MSIAPGVNMGAPINPSDLGHREDEEDAAYEVDGMADKHPRKKRKLFKHGDKKYHCPHDDCGKAYSRAEHLSRHQLNHTPKQIYRCDFPGCDRYFVRADLCARHKERHTAKGSHLQRKDAFINSQRVTGSNSASTVTTSPPSASVPIEASSARPTQASFPVAQPDPTIKSANMMPAFNSAAAAPYPPYSMHELPPLQTATMAPVDSRMPISQPYGTFPTTTDVQTSQMPPPTSPTSLRRPESDGAVARPKFQTPAYASQHSTPMHAAPPTQLYPPHSADAMYAAPPSYPTSSIATQPYRPASNTSNLPSLPPFGLPSGYGAPPPSNNTRLGHGISPPMLSATDQQPMPPSRSNSLADFNVIEQLSAGLAMPVFGPGDVFDRSPVMFDDNFLSSLFNPIAGEMPGNNSPEPVPMHDPHAFEVPLPKLDFNGTPKQEPKPGEPWDEASRAHGIDIDMRESAISANKRQRLVDLLSTWPDLDAALSKRSKRDILGGGSRDTLHVLDLTMLRTYVSSYWLHIHHQLPILHRPTFNPETCPDLLLMTMMCLGAVCLERTHSDDVTKNCADLAFFMAHHIRWEVFRDAEFRPTAKLWTFQTMLLLELFEKMFSTKVLHERAHIHHATILTVMRRGSSLIGRSATDSQQSADDPTRTPPGPDGSINTSGQNTPDPFWNRWITAEATRRVAFAAFILDSTHATLFGHSAIMSPHDLRLPLPCDEALWSATSSAEVQRVEASLAANGFKPITFLDGLKRTLNGQRVRTNTFGRVVIMNGLLNVTWHMNQRDVQISSLNAASTLGNQIKWRSALTRAFDFWRRDFDESLSKNEHWLQVCNPNAKDRASVDRRDNVFESRTCLHSLAHMAMHVDIVDCQIFAGSSRVLGRTVTDSDRAAVGHRMRTQWAPSARARDATFYALRFLTEVLLPNDQTHPARMQHPAQPPTFLYSARDDHLLNRPWVMYYALLIIWSYGYALDGPLVPSNYTLTTRELQIYDMQRYLTRMGTLSSPDDLEKQRDRNSCLGLLLLLRDSFRQPRWELLHEAYDVLGGCMELLLPGGHVEAMVGKQQLQRP